MAIDSSDPGSEKDSGTHQSSRFTAQASTAEDLLKFQTVGLVNLSDFRKRRAEAIEQKERESSDSGFARKSGTVTPSDGASTPLPPNKKKRKAAKGKLSFTFDEDGEDSSTITTKSNSRSGTPDVGGAEASVNNDAPVRKRLGANAALAAPKVMTKSALLREAQTREQLRKEFLVMQEAVKATEFLIPFVFFDGTNVPGGVCRIKKGDHAWLFLDRSRKVGAELGIGGGGEKTNTRREWARVSVDDLMLVRGEIIIPHHYEFYYFIVNKTLGHSNTPLFPYSAEPTSTTLTPSRSATSSSAPTSVDLSKYDPLARPKKSLNLPSVPDADLEGGNEDPTLTKVVDRRWYERNKHIFPASAWEEFDPEKDYSTATRRDVEGNIFFFS